MPSALTGMSNPKQTLSGMSQSDWRNKINGLGAVGARGYNNQLWGPLQQGDAGFDPSRSAEYEAMMRYGADQGWVQPHQASVGGLLKTGAKSVGPVALAALGGGLASGAFGAGISGGAGVGGGFGGAGGLTGAGYAGGSLGGLGGGAAAGAAASGGLLGSLGLTGAQAAALGITGLGTIYGANRASQSAREQTDLARQAMDLANRPRGTQYGSSVDPTSGESVIDPRIRAMRERSLNNVPEYQNILRGQLGSSMEGLGQTRGRLDELYGQTNDNAFMDPILQNLALQRGGLQRGMDRRGLGGSSFYSQALGNFESAAAPGIAQARQQGLQARQGLLGQMGDMDAQGLSAASQGVAQLQNLDNLYANVSGQNLQQELSALGLSQADIGAILGASQQIGQAGQRVSDVYGRGLDVFGRILSPTPVGA